MRFTGRPSTVAVVGRLSWKDPRDAELELPVGPALGLGDQTVGANVEVQGVAPASHRDGAADGQPQRHLPPITGIRLPAVGDGVAIADVGAGNRVEVVEDDGLNGGDVIVVLAPVLTDQPAIRKIADPAKDHA